MKISKKQEMKVTLVIMVFIMTLVVTLVGAGLNYGFQPDFIFKWIKARGLAFAVALPVVMAIMPGIRKVLSKYILD